MHFSCRVLPSSHSPFTARSVITLSEADCVVYCPEPSLALVKSFRFDSAFDHVAPTLDVFEATVQPLMPTVVEGDNAMCVVTSEDAVGKSLTVEGRPAHNYDGACGCLPVVSFFLSFFLSLPPPLFVYPFTVPTAHLAGLPPMQAS